MSEENEKIIVEAVAEDNDTRLWILYLYQMILTQFDEEHPLSNSTIFLCIELLYRRISNFLRVAGIDIIGIRRRAWE